MELYGDWLAFGASLNWPFLELFFELKFLASTLASASDKNIPLLHQFSLLVSIFVLPEISYGIRIMTGRK